MADVLLRRTRLGLLAAAEVSGPGSEVPDASRARWPASSAGTTRGSAEEAERFRVNAEAEGILPG